VVSLISAESDPEQVLELDGDGRLQPVSMAFEDFFAAHHQSVLTALAITLNDPELARDAAAEAMTRAYQRWDDVSRHRNPAGWVYRVGLNRARSRLRKFRREVRRRDLDRDLDRAAPSRDEADPRLEAAMASLSVDHRAVVALRFHLDWSESTTAEALGIAPGTVKSRTSRALSSLAKALEETDADR